MSTFFTFGYSEVIEFDGCFDPLYGTVEPVERGSHRLPRQNFTLNKNVWATYDEAYQALKHVCLSQMLLASQRFRIVQDFDVKKRNLKQVIDMAVDNSF